MCENIEINLIFFVFPCILVHYWDILLEIDNTYILYI